MPLILVSMQFSAVSCSDLNLVYAGIGASLDQWRDRPGQWGQGWGALGERYASHIGQYAVQRSIMFRSEPGLRWHRCFVRPVARPTGAMGPGLGCFGRTICLSYWSVCSSAQYHVPI